MNPLENIRIILVEPIHGGNIGSICRVINNNGITNLSIVNPNERVNWSEAKKLACNATEQLNNITIFSSLNDAIKDCTVVAGTSARTGFYRNISETIENFSPKAIKDAFYNPVALIFGREDKGLNNEELALCTHIIQIPSSDIYKSLNLSHAVMICCYEIFKCSNIFKPSKEEVEIANSDLRERMFKLWEKMMIETEFTEQQKLDHMMMGLRRIFNRGKLTIPDVKILMGIAKQTLWVTDKLNKKKIDNE
ncbi:MAG: RNA methyltransferase [Pontiellaceae bacterium]